MANQRKTGKKKIGFWATDEEKALLLKEARKAGFDNLADWIRSLITKVPLWILLALSAFHLTRTPSDWSPRALAGTGKAALALAKSLVARLP